MPYPLKSGVERSEGLQSSLRGNALSVLVVDDLEVNRLLLARLLQSVGYIAETVPDGETPWRGWNGCHFSDLIVLDLEMPGLSGLETLRHLRQGEDARRGRPSGIHRDGKCRRKHAGSCAGGRRRWFFSQAG